MAWALHYFPFYLMQRQLFLHHYLPALYFSILLFTVSFEALTSRLKPRSRAIAAGAILLLALWGFSKFSNFTYGRPLTKALCEKAKWRRHWDFSWCVSPLNFLCDRALESDTCTASSYFCDGSSDFHDDFSQYGASSANGLVDLKPVESVPVGGVADAQSTMAEQRVAPVEAGPNAFEHVAVPVYEAQAAVALGQGQDPNVPQHGGADDLATGAAAGVTDVPDLPVTLVEMDFPPPAPVQIAEGGEYNALEGQAKADAKKLVEEALRNEIADEEERLRVEQGLLAGQDTVAI